MWEKFRRRRGEGIWLYVLGIESSCDETAASVLYFEGDGPGGVSVGRKPGLGDKGLCPRVLSNVVAHQEDIHKRFGGVVPELASRRHVEMIEPVFRAALEDASVTLDKIGALAVTRGPGLVTALLVGLSAAKGIAWSRGLPLVGVHHLNGHIHSLFLDPNGSAADSGAVGGPPPFPHLAFVISGGHTDFYRVGEFGEIRHLGGTLDDAAGEAYDKVAAAMGLGYPGGMAIDALHASFRAEGGSAAEGVSFPRPHITNRPYDFSFSGLKTAVLNYLKSNGHYRADPDLPPWARPQDMPREVIQAVAASFQEAMVEVLAEKASRAAGSEKLGAISVSGGVASNGFLRERLTDISRSSGWSLHLPAKRYCTDNAAMIACAGGHSLFQKGPDVFMDYLNMDADPSWELSGTEGKGTRVSTQQKI